MGVSGNGEAAAFMTHPAQERLMARMASAGVPAINAPLGVDTRAVHGGRLSLGFDSSVSRLLRCKHFGRIEDGARLSLAAETEALELVLDGDRISAVKVRDPANKVFDIPARHVVLAGGCVQSTACSRSCRAWVKLDPMVGRYMGDHLFRQAVFELPESLGERSLYIFVPPTAERRFHAQLQGMFQETWYSPLHATCYLDGDTDGRYILFYCFGISKAEEAGRMVLMDGEKTRKGYCVVSDRSPGDTKTLAEMAVFTADVARAMGGKGRAHRGERGRLGAARIRRPAHGPRSCPVGDGPGRPLLAHRQPQLRRCRDLAASGQCQFVSHHHRRGAAQRAASRGSAGEGERAMAAQ